ncbi:Spindle and kinetochore-associated protein 3, partial [Antrostomus carolinensis]
DYEDESPVRVLHDLYCEIRTLKEDVNASLGKSCSETQAIHEFMKASEILMQRNAADLRKIRELFQKYGYKPHVKDSTGEAEEEVNSDSTVSVQDKSEEKADDVPHLPACTEKPLVPEDPLRNPQLSDFGLSRYAFSRPWSAVKEQRATNAHQDNSNRTPLKPQTPSILPKTPKCMLKMDDYECATPKFEHFGISEHTMCMNEDYTMSLLRKTAQASMKVFKKHDHEVNVPGMTPREIMVTPGPKPKVTTENAADWMVSPMVLVFCTPDVKIHSRTNSTVLPRSPETNELPFPNKKFTEDSLSFTVSSDEYLKRFRDPSPPKIKQYDQLLNTPPPPEITRIPDDVLQILSKYNNKVDSSKPKEMETKVGNARRYEGDFTDYCNKENR